MTTQQTMPRRKSRALRLSLIGLLALLIAIVVLATVGAFWQQSATARDREAFPPPGRLVDIGAHALHLHCMGEGSPTVILDTIADGISSYWAYVQPEVAIHTRVCTYDRSGLGWSEATPGEVDGLSAAQELHALLATAGEAAPYVTVGHSYGANIARLFWQQYPDDVAGMVLVDPGTLYQDPRLPASLHEQQRTGEMIAEAGRLLAPVGLYRLSEMGLALGATLPGRQRDEFNAYFSTPQYWQAIIRQNAAYPTTSLQVGAIRDMGDLPLVVLSASEPADEVREAMNRINAELAALSTRGEARQIPGATHTGLAIDAESAAVTTAAIVEMIERVR